MTREVLIGPWAWGEVMRSRAMSGALRFVELLLRGAHLSVEPCHGGFQRLDNLVLFAVFPALRQLGPGFFQALLQFFQLAPGFSSGLSAASAARAAMAFSMAAWAASAGAFRWPVLLSPAGSLAGPALPPPAWRGSCPRRSAGPRPGRCPRRGPAPVWRGGVQALARGNHCLFQFFQFDFVLAPACCAAFLGFGPFDGSLDRVFIAAACRACCARCSAAFLRAARLASFSASACSRRSWRASKRMRECSDFSLSRRNCRISALEAR